MGTPKLDTQTTAPGDRTTAISNRFAYEAADTDSRLFVCLDGIQTPRPSYDGEVPLDSPSLNPMHTFLVHALAVGLASRPQPIFACVARGTALEAEALVLGDLGRAGWKVLEVLDPARVRTEFPGLKRHPELNRVMVAARQRGLAFLVLEGEIGD